MNDFTHETMNDFIPDCLNPSDFIPFGPSPTESSRQESSAHGESFTSRGYQQYLQRIRAVNQPGEFMAYLSIQLKVCEGCGSLWLRPAERTTVYCTSCEKTFRSLPRPTRRRRGRPCKNALHLVPQQGGAE